MSEKKDRIPDLFGSLVFNEDTMTKYVSHTAMQAWREALEQGKPLTSAVANDIADGMKNWALEHGATHFTHWFQPLNGVTAEKHDSFISPAGGGKIIMAFSGKELIRGEPDASSFPSGGLRATFEARGYSAWDPTSFAFIKDGSLCIPTVFCSYAGEALDKKTPLLRSMEAVSRQAVRVLRLFGDTTTKKVAPQIGAEQEYFLVDKQMFLQREDLRLCGRTLFGNKPPKGQELDDHYFGAIRPRVAAYMAELDEELWKLGVLSKTKHNEVAPAQHEMAPYFMDANTANDHNQLTMEIMKKVADRHGLVCLLHEKPFAGVNGSGKHINWSLATDSGENLFSPGSTPSRNAQFLLFLSAFIRGIDEYQELLRCTVAFAGNDHRLGAQEAPPAVLSVFLGTELESIVDSLIAGQSYTDHEKGKLRIGVDVLPTIPQDTTDRNRTSPVAFTGNKFEFRMPGASQSIAGPVTVLNAIMAHELELLADKLEGAASFSDTLHDAVHDTLRDHRRIIFGGNGYEDSWLVEAEKRGLCNLRNTAAALPTYILPKNIALLTEQGVYSEAEIRSRHEIHMEKYDKVLHIEATTLLDMVQHSILPAVSEDCAALCTAIEYKRAVSTSLSTDMESRTVEEISACGLELQNAAAVLQAALEEIPATLSAEERLRYDCDTINADMTHVRTLVDKLESLVATKYWPYPRYYDLLFSV